MKEIIAKRNKTSYLFLLAVCVGSILGSVLLLNVQTLPFIKYMAPAAIALFGIFSIVSLFLIFKSGGAVEREGDTLIVFRGITKEKVDISAITDAFPTPHPNDKTKALNNSVTLKLTVNGNEKLITCPDVLNVEEAIQNIKSLIK